MITEKFAAFATSRDLAFPDGLVEKARNAFVDSLGVAIGGMQDRTTDIAYGSVRQDPAGRASFWGRTGRGTAEDAAFVNAVQIHVLDYDDSALSLRGHPSATMMSTAIAVGQEAGAGGADTLRAYAVGLQIACTMSRWLTPKHYLRGWHTTVTAGIFGCTAIAGRLLGLDAAQMRHAFGIAASQAGGLTRNFGSMAKSLSTGHAARAAIQSVKLARAGATADPAILDGPKGFLGLYSGDFEGMDLGLLDALGQRWELLDPGIYVKKWACCYAVHRPIAGLLEFQRQHRIPVDEIRSVAVGFLPGAAHPLNQFDPKTGLEAKFSIEYCVAAALIHGGIDLEAFDDAFVLQPALQAFQKKVTRFEIPNDKFFNGLTGYNELVIDTARGRFEHLIDRTPGSPEWPLTPEEQDRKFLLCATPAVGAARAQSLLASAKALPGLNSLAMLDVQGQ